MTHRAERIVEAVAEAIRTWVPSEISVFVHRRFSLAADAGELPAISVDYGEDTPVGQDGAAMLDGTIESLLTVNVTGVSSKPIEAELRESLIELRKHVHIAINRVRGLGLPFVYGIHYGGANPPDINVDGEQLVGELVSIWGVRYSMNQDSPE